MNKSFYTRAGKRCFDMAAAGLGLFLLLPFFLLVALLVKLSSRGPVFFRQMRVGKSGRPFPMYKFRSMREGAHLGSLLTAAGDPRVTAVGAWLRRTKIDELPQLLNVLLGHMSLVGPRPEVPRFVAQLTEKQRGVLDVRPGITGPSVIPREEELLANSENKETFYLTVVLPAKLEIDLRYCENISFQTDSHILYQTFVTLLIGVHDPYKSLLHIANRPFETAGVAERKNH